MYNSMSNRSWPRPQLSRLKSITHLRTFSDNGVYVALQLFLVILVSDQWHRVLIPYSYRQAPWGLLHARGWLSRYTWDQQLYVVSEPRETHSPMLKARFLHLTNLVAQPGIEPPTSWLPGQRVTTRPRLSVLSLPCVYLLGFTLYFHTHCTNGTVVFFLDAFRHFPSLVHVHRWLMYADCQYQASWRGRDMAGRKVKMSAALMRSIFYSHMFHTGTTIQAEKRLPIYTLSVFSNPWSSAHQRPPAASSYNFSPCPHARHCMCDRSTLLPAVFSSPVACWSALGAVPISIFLQASDWLAIDLSRLLYDFRCVVFIIIPPSWCKIYTFNVTVITDRVALYHGWVARLGGLNLSI